MQNRINKVFIKGQNISIKIDGFKFSFKKINIEIDRIKIKKTFLALKVFHLLIISDSKAPAPSESMHPTGKEYIRLHAFGQNALKQ